MKLTDRQNVILAELQAHEFVTIAQLVRVTKGAAVKGIRSDITALRGLGFNIDVSEAGYHLTAIASMGTPEGPDYLAAFDTDVDHGDETDGKEWGV